MIRMYILRNQDLLTPEQVTQALKASGFTFDNETCPVRIKRPMVMARLETGELAWFQWDKADEPRREADDGVTYDREEGDTAAEAHES